MTIKGYRKKTFFCGKEKLYIYNNIYIRSLALATQYIYIIIFPLSSFPLPFLLETDSRLYIHRQSTKGHHVGVVMNERKVIFFT